MRLRFSNRKQGLIEAKNSANIAIIGFDSSFAKGSLRVQGRVKVVDAPNRRITVAIEPGYPGFDASDSPERYIFYLLEPGTEGRLKTGAPNFFRADGTFKREAEGLWSFTIPRWFSSRRAIGSIGAKTFPIKSRLRGRRTSPLLDQENHRTRRLRDAWSAERSASRRRPSNCLHPIER